MKPIIKGALAALVLLLVSAPSYAQMDPVARGIGAAAVSVTSKLPAPYTGLVATRAEIPVTTVSSATGTWAMSASIHQMRQSVPANGVKLVFANYYVANTNIETGIGTGTFKAAIEYPIGGTIYPCTFNGAATISVAALAYATTDACGPTMPNGALFRQRVLYTNPNGIIFSGIGTGHYDNTFESFQFGTGTATDKVNSGALAAGNGGNLLVPVAVIGTTVKPSVCITGDSRATGIKDLTLDATRDTGEIARSLGPEFAYTKLSVASTTIAQALTNFTNRLAIVAYCSHAVDQYGINDKGVGVTDATLASNRTAFAALLGIPTFGTTLPATDTSTDNFATTTNQTVATSTDGFNALERAGISGEVGFFDIANAIDPLDLQKWPVSKVVGTTSGAANFSTPDGTHENPTMNLIIKQSGAVNPAWITR